MPRYNQPPRVVAKEEALRMIEKAKNPQHKNLVRLQWIFGKRPKEVVSLKRDNFEIAGDILRMKLVVSKRRKNAGIIGINQKLVINEVSISMDPLVKELADYIITIPMGEYLFTFRTPDRIKTIFYELTKCGTCQDCLQHRKCKTSIPPYFARHSRCTQLGRVIGANVKDLMDWNGWDNTQTAGKYLIREPSTKFKGKIE